MQEVIVSRRGALAATVALPLICILSNRGSAAEFSYKLATGQDPTHPINTRARQAVDRIREASQGRVEIRLFPANQLGSDTDLLSQLRSGGVEFFNLSTSILAPSSRRQGFPIPASRSRTMMRCGGRWMGRLVTISGRKLPNAA